MVYDYIYLVHSDELQIVFATILATSYNFAVSNLEAWLSGLKHRLGKAA